MTDTRKNDCLFCNFDKTFVIEESEYAFASYFNCAVRPGHIVIALKEHVTSLSRLTTGQAGDIMQLAAKTARKAEPLVGCEKFYLVSIADETPHYHLHLMPKMPGDPGIGRHIMSQQGWSGEVGQPVNQAELLKFVDLYKRNS